METNSFYIETYGCASNRADSYIISSVLKRANHVPTTIENAEFIIVNTCGVKEQTENKIKARLKTLYQLYGNDLNKHIIIAGCLPHVAPNYIKVIKNIIPTFSAIIDLNNINELPEIFQKIRRGKKNLILKSNKHIDKANFFIDHQPNKITGIVPISEGCLGSCTYCCVKNARGSLYCYDPQNIIKNIKYQLKQGIKQIYLTSQDCSIYKREGTNLKELINQIVELKYKFFLRLGMINPKFLIDDLDQLISIYKLAKVYQFLHIPIQSGSNNVLKRMQRPYLISDIVDPIEKLRKLFPSLTVSTDIICGFPGESEHDFYRTINFIKWLKPEIMNISKFTARPGTIAKEMKKINSRTIKERSGRLSRVFRNSLIKINEKWKGWEGEVLVLHEGTEPNQAIGRNFAYKNVLINDYNGNFGHFINMKIDKVNGFNFHAITKDGRYHFIGR